MDFATLSPAMAQAVNYGAWICQIFQPFIGKKLLEVGGGFDTVRPHCPVMEHYWSVDIDPAVVALARQRYPQGDHVQANILQEEFINLFGKDKPDTILCVNVLEHLTEDQQAISNLLAILPPGGRLLILVPAFQALFGPMDQLAGHLRRYDKHSFRQLLTNQPGQLLRLDYFNSLGGLGWWINRWGKPASLADTGLNRQIIWFDRFGVPLSRWLDPLTRNFFGQSLVAVVEKKP
ncbi:MAG: class I SAM-dependent methyltransferase [Magnetococcales bacterium]|nr:class I SAM-dependent methyltransferase [Magnetococcales bacterium]NGZ25437.1 class I SAM-dependent methyltransferase [Magnetococcales bacterium]